MREEFLELLKELVRINNSIEAPIFNSVRGYELGVLINEISDLNKKIEYINKYIDRLGSSGIVPIIRGTNGDEKIELIELYFNILAKKDLGSVIGSIKDISKTREYIDKYIDRLGSIGIERAIILKSDEEKKELIDRYNKELDEVDLGRAIGSIEDINATKEYIDKYIDKLDSPGIESAIFLKCDDEIILLIELYAEKLASGFLGKLISNIYDRKKREEQVDKYIDVLDSKELKLAISVENDVEMIKLIEKYCDKLSNKDLGILIRDLKSLNKTREQINKYIDKLGEIGLVEALYKQFDDEKIELIDIYSEKLSNEYLELLISSIKNLKLKFKCIGKYLDRLSSEIIYNEISKIKDNDTRFILFLRYMNKFSIIQLTDLYLKKQKVDGQEETIKSLKALYSGDPKKEKLFDDMKVLCNSNSLDIQHIAKYLLSSLESIPNEQHDAIIKRVEEIFLNNSMPTMVKLYKVFEIMHPNVENFKYYKVQSPNLNLKNSSLYKKSIIFSDLIRITIRSNNRSLKEFVKSIEQGNEIAKLLIENDFNYDKIPYNFFVINKIFNNFVQNLNLLYNNTLYGKKNPRKMTNNLEKDFLELMRLFSINEPNFNIDKLPDRIIKMFCHFANIDTFEELKSLMNSTIVNADKRNRERAKNNNFELHKGDFVKGLANQDTPDEFYQFLNNILQNGSLCKEFLGCFARSDTTPLDTDVSKILTEPKNFESTFKSKNYASTRYGPIWVVLNNDNRFNDTNESNEYINGKLEVFKTNMDGYGHYGIRTGFASSDIDYFVVDEDRIKLDRIKYEIVMNGFYIPILNTKKQLIFTPEEYDNLHKNMAGLSFYGTENEYEFAKELDSFDLNNLGYDIDIERIIKNTKVRSKLIIDTLLNIDDAVSIDRSEINSDKTIELIQVGSMSRHTSISENNEFNFIMRVDNEVYVDDNKMKILINKVKEVLPNVKFEGNNIINQEIVLSNGEKAKLNLCIVIKTDKNDYSTNDCLEDRLYTIYNMDKKMYKKVLENIVLAKRVLKEVFNSDNIFADAFIDNWILQNGGSFIHAAKDFLTTAEGKSFEEFCKIYTIWDFGYISEVYRTKDGYEHVEYVKEAITEDSYKEMINVLKSFFNNIKQDSSHINGKITGELR